MRTTRDAHPQRGDPIVLRASRMYPQFWSDDPIGKLE